MDMNTIQGKETAIQKQIQLPMSVAMRISVQSIRIRFLRSMITAAGTFLGIAFFVSVRASSIFSPVVGTSAEAIEAANRQTWLVIMSLLMCTVGITNSMLMAVTERYKEIGTMKCLGALDSFVVKLFFIESGLLGLVASFLGFTLGFLLVFIINLFRQGGAIFTDTPWTSVLALFGISMMIGVVLTVIATILPAIRAAKMPAAAALRVEV